VTFTDDYTRKSWVYLTESRKELRTVFIQFKTRVELESGHKIKAIRCDNAPEYRSLGDLLQRDYGIQFEYTTVYTPEQNGVSERLNRSLVAVARAMLQGAGLPARFWGDAVITACYLRNRTLIGPDGKTLEEAYSGKKPYIGHLRAYGCLVYAHIPKERR
jgi:transposase InsO family protein